jgi:hypothetical protein
MCASTLLDCLEESTPSANAAEAMLHENFHSTWIFVDDILDYHVF